VKIRTVKQQQKESAEQVTEQQSPVTPFPIQAPVTLIVERESDSACVLNTTDKTDVMPEEHHQPQLSEREQVRILL
jgi:hypothetical protein